MNLSGYKFVKILVGQHSSFAKIIHPPDTWNIKMLMKLQDYCAGVSWAGQSKMCSYHTRQIGSFEMSQAWAKSIAGDRRTISLYVGYGFVSDFTPTCWKLSDMTAAFLFAPPAAVACSNQLPRQVQFISSKMSDLLHGWRGCKCTHALYFNIHQYTRMSYCIRWHFAVFKPACSSGCCGPQSVVQRKICHIN